MLFFNSKSWVAGIAALINVSILNPVFAIPVFHANADQLEESSIAGIWNSSEGQINFSQTGNSVTGTYDSRPGSKIVGQLGGNVLQGYWIQTSAARRCDTPYNGNYYYGRIRFEFTGSTFQGVWGYCNDVPSVSWNGDLKTAARVTNPRPVNNPPRPTSSIAGAWNSSEGRMTLRQKGSSVTGTYDSRPGSRIVGQLGGNILQGFWIQRSAARRCDTPYNGNYYYGRIRFEFTGSTFKGVWGYCNDVPSTSWTGKRR